MKSVLFFTGSKVFCWDVNLGEVVSTLDCANIIPAVDSYKIHKLKRFEGKRHCRKFHYIGFYIKFTIVGVIHTI